MPDLLLAWKALQSVMSYYLEVTLYLAGELQTVFAVLSLSLMLFIFVHLEGSEYQCNLSKYIINILQCLLHGAN